MTKTFSKYNNSITDKFPYFEHFWYIYIYHDWLPKVLYVQRFPVFLVVSCIFSGLLCCQRFLVSFEIFFFNLSQTNELMNKFVCNISTDTMIMRCQLVDQNLSSPKKIIKRIKKTVPKIAQCQKNRVILNNTNLTICPKKYLLLTQKRQIQFDHPMARVFFFI